MALLEVRGISKSFGSVRAVDGASFAAERGEIIGMLGPSGCGKSTLLRLLAGLEQPDAGTVTFDGHPLDGLAPQQRGFGLMFQDLALFPHMDVSANVSFGLRMQGADKPAIQERVGELLALVEMSAYSQRKVHELSGGERQRVALARSLAPSPKLLMLDEPLGSLDRVLRDSLQSQVRRILKEVGVTSIYVTHDRDEAFAISDRLVFMNRGSVVQAGTPEQLVAAPADEFVARSLGFKNVLQGVVLRYDEVVEIECPLGVLAVDAPRSLDAAVGAKVMLLVDERGVAIRSLSASGELGRNEFRGTVVERVFRGAEHDLTVSTGRCEIHSLASPDEAGRMAEPGQEVTLEVDPKAVRLLNGGSLSP